MTTALFESLQRIDMMICPMLTRATVPMKEGKGQLEPERSESYTRQLTVGLSPSTTHSGLETIGSSARKHLVDADDVVGVDTDTEVERVLSGGLDDVLVGANTGGLEGLRRELLVLVGDEVAAEGL
jgi:hypothetical protein